MRAYVRFQIGEGEIRELGPGDIIGRMWTAALNLADPFVSEAHALVSLREGALKLLALRGRLAVVGKSVTEVTLSTGLRVDLSPRTTLTVTALQIPTIGLALDHPELGQVVLSGVASLAVEARVNDGGRERSSMRLSAGASPNAAAVLWSDGLSWQARLRDGADVPLVAGEVLTIEGRAIAINAVSMNDGHITTLNPAGLESPLHLVVRYDTVHIHRPAAATLTLDGIIARIVSDLATAAVPVGWLVLANDIWRGESDTTVLRRNWDAALARLRKKLRDARVRTDLVRADHSGNFELFLATGDRVDDQT